MKASEATTVILVGSTLFVADIVGVIFRFLPLIAWIALCWTIRATWGTGPFWLQILRMFGIVVLVFGTIPYLKYPKRWICNKIAEREERQRKDQERSREDCFPSPADDDS